MANFFKSKGFKYVKNLIIGVGASVVLVGALFKIQSWPYADEMLTFGMLTEAFLFLMLGLLPPDKDYYWEKLFPGLENYNGSFSAPAPFGSGIAGGAAPANPLDGKVVETHLDAMLKELSSMSKNLGALQSLQQVDFSGMKDQLHATQSFYDKLNAAMKDLEDSAGQTSAYLKSLEQLNANVNTLNSKYASLNQIYGGVISAMTGRQG